MMETRMNVGSLHRLVLFLVIALSIVGCQSIIGPESAGETESSEAGKRPGQIRGVEGIEEIKIRYSRVRLLREVDGVKEWVNVDLSGMTKQERTFDLLSVLDGFEAFLGDATMEPGVYLKMRVRVKRAWITVNGVESRLKVKRNVIRLRETFEVGPSGLPHLPLDFNASDQVREKARGRYRYVTRFDFHTAVAPPVLQVGTITGAVVPSVYALVTLYESGSSVPVASVYADSDTEGFRFEHFPVGVYDLEASAPGYYSGWLRGLVLTAGELSEGHELLMDEMGGGEKR